VKHETELLEAAARGDADAFGRLVSSYQDRLFTSITHLLNDAHEAEDVVQEALVQAYFRLDQFRGDSSFYTWLYRIAFNLAISSRRSRKSQVSVEASRENAGQEMPDPSGAPDTNLLHQEQVREVHAALATLSEEHRAVIVLRDLEDCDYEQIATILEISKGTVRSRLHRARSLMREHLERVRRREPKS
jgi:RNA polymerase sigma-70 factor (ECF subfamily)